jgi:transcriptional regulator with XRE-family HTH domain
MWHQIGKVLVTRNNNLQKNPIKMNLSTRIRRIREIRGLKQSSIALELNITQQSYGNLENQLNNPKLETLTRFCEVVKIPLSFLLDTTIPMTDENVALFSQNSMGEIFSNYKNLKERLEYMEELRNKRDVNRIKQLPNSAA